MQQEIQLLAESVVKLVLKNRDARYVSAIALDKDKLRVDYSNGYHQKIDIPQITKETIISTSNNDSQIEEIKKEIAQRLKENVRFSTKSYKKQSTELKKAREEMGMELDALNTRIDGEIKNIAAKYFNIAEEDKKSLLLSLTELEQKLITLIEKAVNNIEVKNGENGKDADEEKIIAELQKILKEELISLLQQGLEEIKNSIPEVKDGMDGRDADEEAIFLRLERKLESAVLNIKVKDGKDGVDGKNADEEDIKAYLKESLLLTLNDYKEEITLKINEELEEKEKELKTAILDIIKEQIALIPQAEDGVDGQDGADADEEVIKARVLAEIELLVSQKLLSAESNLKELVIDLVSQIKAPKGDKGEPGESIKGDKGDSIKGDKGNGIKSAEVDPMGELIIHTDEKKIRAGKVGITNIFGGGGGSSTYTNSKPSLFEVGGLKKGTRFKNTDLRNIFTQMLYGVAFPEFAKFIVTDMADEALVSPLEVGAKLEAGDYKFVFEISNTELLEDNSIVIEQNGTVIASNLTNISPVSITLDEQVITEATMLNFTISAYDSTGVSFSKAYGLQFLYKIYYGEGAENIILKDPVTLEDYSNPLMAFRARALVHTIIDEEYYFPDIIDPQAVLSYRWFCVPKVFGERWVNYVLCDLKTDVAASFAEPKEIIITNNYDLPIPYYCYRTENQMFGELTLKVKSG